MMIDAQTIQWFPGHMAKTRRLMKENLKMVDVVIELIDARIPYSSRNPEIDKIVDNKPRLIVLNKSDAADERTTKAWIAYFKEKGIPAIATDCKSGKGLGQLVPAVRQVLGEQLERWEKKGMKSRPIRMMIVGIPNVGKSSFINRLAGNRRAKVEDRPGVTRGKQWVSLQNGMELLDMPGVLWPKFEEQLVGENLAFTGAIKDDVIDIELLGMRFLQILAERYPNMLCQRYKMDKEELAGKNGAELLELVARKRGMLISGGEPNTERAAITVMDEFRSATIGRISLEEPPKADQKPDSSKEEPAQDDTSGSEAEEKETE